MEEMESPIMIPWKEVEGKKIIRRDRPK